MTPGMSSTTASRRPMMRLTSVDLPTFGRPTTASIGTRRTRLRWSPSSPSAVELPVRFVGPDAVAGETFLGHALIPVRSHTIRYSSFTTSSRSQLAGVDDDRIIGRTQRRHRAGGIEPIASLHVGKHGRVIVAAALARCSARSAAGHAPRRRRSGRSSRRRRGARRCRCRGPRPRSAHWRAISRCMSTSQLRTSATAETAETALVTWFSRISERTSSPARLIDLHRRIGADRERNP